MSATEWTYKNWRYIPGRSHHQVEVTVYRWWQNVPDYPCLYLFVDVDEALDFWKEDYRELKSGPKGFKVADVKIKVFDEDHDLLECVHIDPWEYLCMSPDDKLPRYERPQCHLPVEAKLALEESLPELCDLVRSDKAERVLHDLQFTLEEHGLILPGWRGYDGDS